MQLTTASLVTAFFLVAGNPGLKSSGAEQLYKDRWSGVWPFSSPSGVLTCEFFEERPAAFFWPDKVADSNDGDGGDYIALYLTRNEWVMWNEAIAAEESYVGDIEPEDLMDAIKPFVDAGELLCASDKTKPAFEQ